MTSLGHTARKPSQTDKMHIPTDPIVFSFPNPNELITSLAEFIIKAQADAILKKNRFTIALSGGSLPKMLKGVIGKGCQWDKWYARASSS